MASAELSRRDVLRRGAAVGVATVWVTPVIQSIGGNALAATGSPSPTPSSSTSTGSTGTTTTSTSTSTSTKPAAATSSNASVLPTKTAAAEGSTAPPAVAGSDLAGTGSSLPLPGVVALGAALTAGGYATYRASHKAPPGKHRPSNPVT